MFMLDKLEQKVGTHCSLSFISEFEDFLSSCECRPFT